jgi:hypothetical protein
MNTANKIDLMFLTTLSTLVVTGLVLTGMASAIAVGGLAAGAYLVTNN